MPTAASRTAKAMRAPMPRLGPDHDAAPPGVDAADRADDVALAPRGPRFFGERGEHDGGPALALRLAAEPLSTSSAGRAPRRSTRPGRDLVDGRNGVRSLARRGRVDERAREARDGEPHASPPHSVAVRGDADGRAPPCRRRRSTPRREPEALDHASGWKPRAARRAPRAQGPPHDLRLAVAGRHADRERRRAAARPKDAGGRADALHSAFSLSTPAAGTTHAGTPFQAARTARRRRCRSSASGTRDEDEPAGGCAYGVLRVGERAAEPLRFATEKEKLLAVMGGL